MTGSQYTPHHTHAHARTHTHIHAHHPTLLHAMVGPKPLDRPAQPTEGAHYLNVTITTIHTTMLPCLECTMAHHLL